MIQQVFVLAHARFFAQLVNNCPPDDSGCAPSTNLPEVAANEGNLKLAIQLVFGIIGAVALIYVIMAAFQLVASQGDPQGLNKARQTIIFAMIGLVIALSAEIIVTFVILRA